MIFELIINLFIMLWWTDCLWTSCVEG